MVLGKIKTSSCALKGTVGPRHSLPLFPSMSPQCPGAQFSSATPSSQYTTPCSRDSGNSTKSQEAGSVTGCSRPPGSSPFQALLSLPSFFLFLLQHPESRTPQEVPGPERPKLKNVSSHSWQSTFRSISPKEQPREQLSSLSNKKLIPRGTERVTPTQE